MTGPLNVAIPNIGHANAGNNPDGVAIVWADTRLIRERVDNKTRFLEAVVFMLRRLAKYVDPKISPKELRIRETTLKDDLDHCIGGPDPTNAHETRRISLYRKLSRAPEYGGQEMEPYDTHRWMDDVVNEDVRGLRDRGDTFLARLDPLTDTYTWKDHENYKQTHWYRFQEAVKKHQNETWEILAERNFKGLELPEL